MRLLYVTPEPLGGLGGGALHCWHNLRALGAQAGVEIDCVSLSPPRRLPDGEIQYHCIPPPNLVDKVRSALLGYAAASGAKLSVLCDTLNRRRPYDVMFCEFTRLGPLVRKMSKSVPCVVSMHNVEADYFGQAVGSSRRVIRPLALASERQSLMAASLRLFLSDADLARAVDLYGENVAENAMVGPIAVSGPLLPRRPAQEKGRVLLYVGSLGTWFNENALEGFLLRHWRAGGQTRFVIAGSGASARLRALVHRTVGVELYDSPNEATLARLWNEARFLLVPDQSAVGMKVKIAEGLSWGVPSIGTRMALRGYVDCDQWAVLTKSTPTMTEIECAMDGSGYPARTIAAVRAWESRYNPLVMQRRMADVLRRVM